MGKEVRDEYRRKCSGVFTVISQNLWRNQGKKTLYISIKDKRKVKLSL
jgi:hypothetical protein